MPTKSHAMTALVAKVVDALTKRALATPQVCEGPISCEEVTEAIRLSKRGRTPGSDGPPYEYYKQHSKELTTFLTPMYNELIKLELITHSMTVPWP